MERQREDLRERKPYYASSVPAVPVHQDEPRKKCTAPCRRGALQARCIVSMNSKLNSKFAILAFGVKCAGRNAPRWTGPCIQPLCKMASISC